MFKNRQVGRVNKLDLKNKKVKNIIMYGLPVLIVVIGIIVITSGSLSNLMGNSVTTYYCEDSTYTLNGTKCTKQIKEKAHLVGDINGDSKVTSVDTAMTNQQIRKVKSFNEFQIAAMDVNKDGNIDEQDLQIINAYVTETNVSENMGSYEVGEELVCPNDYELDNGYCIKTLTVDAKSKVEQIKDKYTITFSYRDKSTTQIVSKGEKTKLSKNEFDNSTSVRKYFAGWIVRTKEDKNGKRKTYCYTNEEKTKKSFVDTSSGSCGAYDYAKLEDEQEIPDEILIDDLELTATFDQNVTATIDTVSAKTIDIKTGKTIEYELNRKDYPHNTKITVKINFKINDKDNDYYYKIIKRDENGKSEGICKKIDSSKTIEENLELKQKLTTNMPQSSIELKGYKDSNCTIIYQYGEKSTDIYSTVASKLYYVSLINVEYELNGGTIENAPLNLAYNYGNKVKLLSAYKNGYEFLGFRIKDEDNKYLCYTNSSKTKQDYVDEKTCEKYGYLTNSLVDNIFFSNPNENKKITFVAQWSDTAKKESDITFSLNCPSDLSSCKDRYVSPMKHVLQGTKTKLNNYIGSTYRQKVTSDKYYSFGGWSIQNTDIKKYYCYTNKEKTKQGYTDGENCKKYGYVYLKNNQEVPDEILGGNLTLKARWITDNELVNFEPIEEETKNIQNGNITKNTDVKNRKYFAANSNISFRINVDKYSTMNKYQIKYTTNTTGGTKISECKSIPTSGEIIEKIPAPTPSDTDTTPSYKMSVGILLFPDSCYSSSPVKNKEYELQIFKVKYDANGGKVFYNNSNLKRVSNINLNSYTALYYYNSDKRLFKSRTAAASVKRPGYDLIGYKVKNSSNKYICYKDSKKSSKGYTDESYCKKYGYVIYGPNDQLSRTTSKHEETLTFIAQWTNNPVTINIGKLNETWLDKGDKVHLPITFKINDKENTYYYKWGYLKWGSYNSRKNEVKNTAQFIDRFDSFKNIKYGQYGDPYTPSGSAWHLDRSDGCRKVKENDKYIPTLTIENYITAGMIVLYNDSNCKNMISSEKNAHKLTEVYFCKNCN